MNRALWKKTLSDSWLQLTVSMILLLLFAWLFTWLMSFFEMGRWTILLNLMPKFIEPLVGLPIAKMASTTGQLSILYMHLITWILCLGWIVGRSSDLFAGRLARGTLELMLTLPVRRITIFAVPVIVTTLGTTLLVVSLWVGGWLGIATIAFQDDVSAKQFLPGALNLFAMLFCFAGITSFFSCLDTDRWRVIWRAGGFFVVSLLVKTVSRLWPSGEWLRYFSFLTAVEPQRFILIREESWSQALYCDATLVALGLLAYSAAALVFCRRDIPVPR